jgi:hypothetical protein
MELWIVGICLVRNGQEIGWMAEGAFLTESEAAAAAKNNEFIVCVKTGERFPQSVDDAIKLYWPKQETWEQSKLYIQRHGSIKNA